MDLIPIERDGTVKTGISLNELAQDICRANRDNYDRSGFSPRWGAYLAVVDGVVIGTCAFKSPPLYQRAEIAYFTFPDFEGRGYATQMATLLIEIAHREDSRVQVFAQTLPEKNASTRILTKLGFVRTQEILHPEDGLIWEWELRSAKTM